MNADVCLILEGTYPYVTGGVSSWTHDIIKAHPTLTFHLLPLLAPEASLTPRFEVPPNVVGQSPVFLQKIPAGCVFEPGFEPLLRALEEPLTGLLTGGGLTHLEGLLKALNPLFSRHLIAAQTDAADKLEMTRADPPRVSRSEICGKMAAAYRRSEHPKGENGPSIRASPVRCKNAE
ncbi:MAG: DUF3492 domain-containing protein [Acidobacteria bacterium]|nr:DUF3492 domain-containing protein [Acidobacteriota bacterium]